MKKNNFKSLMQAAVLVCTPLVIASCDDVFGDADNPISSYLTVSQAAVNLELHADRPDAAIFTRKANAATGAEVVYSSSDEKVATVDANGKITGVGEGECKIIVEATGKDSHGNMTYQEAKDSFTVNVKDYRARIELIEGAEIPVYNSADASLAEIDLSKVIKVWPANVNIDFAEAVASSVINIVTDKTTGQESIQLTGTSGTAKVTAAIDPTEVIVNKKLFETFEQKSFPKNQKTAEFEITVKEGVAYIAGYDAKGAEIRKTMFKGDGADEYTKLSTLLDGASADVTLDAGWYLLDKSYTSFAHNIRVKGDVNIILGGFTLDLAKNSKDIMDESAKQNYKLNFYKEEKAAPTVNIRSIKDFKEVNICGVIITSPVDAVESVSIINGSAKNLTGTGKGNVSITDGSADDVTDFTALTLTKVDKAAKPDVDDVTNVGTVTLSEGTSANNLKGITTLTVTKATVGNIGGAKAEEKVGTATITGADKALVATSSIQNIGTLTLDYVSAGADLDNITTLNINKGSEIGTSGKERDLTNIGTINLNAGKVFSDDIIAGKLIIKGGEMEVNNQIRDYDAKNKKDAACKLTMTDGKLTVGKSLKGTVFAVIGDVEVSGGTFYSVSVDHHAVDGALVGTFEGSTDGKSWKDITGAERPAYIQNKKSE
jgi:hypothetical protein